MMRQLLRMFLLSLVAVAVCATPTWAVDTYWNVATGDVSLGSNWNTGNVPESADLTYIANNGTATIGDDNTFAGTLPGLRLGNLVTVGEVTTGYYGNITQTGGAVALSNTFYLGYRDNLSGVTSVYDMSGGTLTSTGMVVIGFGLGANGKLLLSGGDTENSGAALTTSSRIFIGDTHGKGVVEMSGYSSLASTGNTLYLGRGSDTLEGTLKMSDNATLSLAVSTADSFIGGNNGGAAKGTMEMSGNTSATIGSRRVQIGNGVGAQGRVKMSGSSQLAVTENADNNGNYQFLIGSGGGTGTMELDNNASVTVNSTRTYIGTGTGSSGTLTITGESQMTVNSTGLFRVGDAATGTISLSGGDATTPGAKLTAAGTVAFGVWAGTGTLNVSEYAEFVAGSVLTLGDNSGTSGTGTGNMYVSGHGKVTVNGLNLGDFARGVGNVVLTDNAVVTSTAAVHVGYRGTGTMTLGGGSLLSATTVRSATHDTFGTGAGTLYFDGGTLQARASYSDFMAHNGGTLNTIIQSGGATIDSNGFDIGITVDLAEDSESTGGGLTKLGDGTLTLGGANTYTGATLVEAGGLSVTGSITSGVTVADGAALLGSGAILGNVVAAAGSTVAPGTSIGTLTVTGDLTIGGTLAVEYDSDTLAIDLINVSGTLDLTNASLSFSDIGASVLAGGPYVFATYGTLVGYPAMAEVNVPTGYFVDYAYGGNSVALTLIPEPSTLALLVGLFALLAGCRTRR